MIRSLPVATTLAAAVALSFVASSGHAQSTTGQAVGASPDSLRPRAQDLRPMLVRDSVRRRSGYAVPASASSTRTLTALRDVPQSISVVSRALIADQSMQSMADVVRYVPGVVMGLGEGHRDAPTIRGNASTADFFVNGVRDDAQYLRDLYNVERVEALKGSNAMAFGRGGGGGVLNRVTKEAQWLSTLAFNTEFGAFGHQRVTLDVGNALSANAALRLTAVVDESGTFRMADAQRRQAVNPTAAFLLSPRTIVRLGYEYVHDARRIDRGIPSYQGRPALVRYDAFFGNPDLNTSTMAVQSGSTLIEHETANGIQIRNRTHLAGYAKFYQNTFAGVVSAAGDSVALSAYNHRIDRRNLFNQTDVTWRATTGRIAHTLLVGGELAAQETQQFRNTGFFGGAATSLRVPLASPTIGSAVAFRQSGTDPDNQSSVSAASAYVQDQAALSTHLQVIAGVRLERFDVQFLDSRTNARLSRTDHLVSPRIGLNFKPVERASVYSSISRSWLPSSGDQFTALTVTTQTLKPERFTNRELGFKFDFSGALSVSSALFQLDRTNTIAPDPVDATRVIQTGAQRTRGVEVGATGDVTSAWQLAAGLSVQDARILSTTTSAKAGATVPLVPRATASVWNRFQLSRRLGVGLGIIHQSRSYAAIDNSVALSDFTRIDGALFAQLHRTVRMQVNIENALNRRYVGSSHGNNNIMPGAPRNWRVTLSVLP